MDLEALAKGKYLSLTTMKKDGSAVSTPVWLVREGDALLVITQGSSAKVRRIRNEPHVLLAPCDARGRIKGEQVAGCASLLGPEETARIAALIRKRYGFLGWILTRRGSDDRMGIRLTVA